MVDTDKFSNSRIEGGIYQDNSNFLNILNFSLF